MGFVKSQGITAALVLAALTTTLPMPSPSHAQVEPPPALLRFAVIGDFGSAGQPEADVAALVHGWQPAFILTTGDNNYTRGDAATIDTNIGQYYSAFIAPYTGTYSPSIPAADNRFWPVLGNHDWQAGNLAAPYRDYFSLPGNERYYDLVRGDVHLFMLNSNAGEPDGVTADSAQAQWLQQRLAASAAPWKIVVFHHPPYSSGPHGSNTFMQWPFKAWGASLVLAGHDHDYERLEVDGLTYLVDGLGGQPARYHFGTPLPQSRVRYNADFGALRIETSACWLSAAFLNRQGDEIDSFLLSAPLSAPTSGTHAACQRALLPVILR